MVVALGPKAHSNSAALTNSGRRPPVQVAQPVVGALARPFAHETPVGASSRLVRIDDRDETAMSAADVELRDNLGIAVAVEIAQEQRARRGRLDAVASDADHRVVARTTSAWPAPSATAAAANARVRIIDPTTRPYCREAPGQNERAAARPTEPRARARASAAPTKSRKSGAGRVGRDLNSGWNCDATNHG